jgi:hypothetical protein
MENKKWYWDSLGIIHKKQTENLSWFNDFIVVRRKDYIKLIHKKLQTKDLAYYSIKAIEDSIEFKYYHLEVCGDIQIITNIIKEKIRDIKLSQLGI